MALPHPYSHCTVKYAEAEGERPRLLLGTQVYFPASSGFTRKMIRVPSIKIRTLNFRSLQTNKKTRKGGVGMEGRRSSKSQHSKAARSPLTLPIRREGPALPHIPGPFQGRSVQTLALHLDRLDRLSVSSHSPRAAHGSPCSKALHLGGLVDEDHHCSPCPRSGGGGEQHTYFWK